MPAPRRVARRLILFTLGVGAVVAPAFLTASILQASPESPVSKHASASRPSTYSPSGFDVTPLTDARIAALVKEQNLTAEEERIILRSGTEPAFCGLLVDTKDEGVYACRLCGLPLFASDTKFTSGTGWPSFYKPYDAAHIENVRDTSHGMARVEIRCARCAGHLGHVFDDGPRPTGLRYCLNSASMQFFRMGELPERSKPIATETAYFAGGCFWGVEDRLQHTAGVLTAISGYQGGAVEDPNYRQVCYTDTGHAESVKVVFDPSVVTYRELLEKFFAIHDPTQVNRQGPDVGTQYRSAIFAADDAQLAEARAFVDELATRERFKGKMIATQVNPMATFWEAEEYHQDYHLKHGGSCALPAE